MELNLREATYFDCYDLAKRIRQGDKDEMWAMARMLPHQGVLWSVSRSVAACAATIDGQVCMVWGVAPLVHRDGACPWMLGSEILRKYAVRFYHITKEHVDEMLEVYGYLENHVDARNKESIRWLKWLGFTIHEPEPYGADGLPFHRFSMGGDD